MTDDDQVQHQSGEQETLDEIKRLEEDPPDRLEDWPSGKAKYMTMGGPEGQSGYEEGPTSKLGPSELRYHEDGNVTVGGEPVDNPDEFKGDPIPGGPTDPTAADEPGNENREIPGAEDPDGDGGRGKE